MIDLERAQHVNSLTAYREEVRKLGKRKTRILAILARAPLPLTAREVLAQINAEDGTNIQDPNLVRPRLTELKNKGLVVEIPDGIRRDPETGKRVGAFQALPQACQLALL